jgi:hypothetical protein
MSNMNEITPTYVTFEQAKKLKEKGYPQLNKGLYYTKDKEHCLVGWGFNDRTENSFAQYSAPKQWQVLEWFRVNHGIVIYNEFMISPSNNFRPIVVWKDSEELLRNKKILTNNCSPYPQEAISSAIDYTLDKLI